MKGNNSLRLAVYVKFKPLFMLFDHFDKTFIIGDVYKQNVDLYCGVGRLSNGGRKQLYVATGGSILNNFEIYILHTQSC